MDERLEPFYLSLENGAAFTVSRGHGYIEVELSERTGAAEWSAKMQLDVRSEARKLRDWLNENVHG